MIRSRALLAIALLALVTSATAQRNKGHQVTGTRISVETPEHWSRWALPFHAVDVLPEGRVRPHFFRNRYNILDDLKTFTRTLPELRRKRGETAIFNIDSTETLDVSGQVIVDRQGNTLYSYFVRPGISRVGSNPAAAAHILDGDPNTYWEPNLDESLENWWIEVDLGRVVPVDEIVLHFVGEEAGDPFRQFRVLAAPDQRPVQQDASKLLFEVVGGTKAPNRDERTFRFPLEQVKASPEWSGKMVETLRIVVTDTRGGRGTLLDSQEEYEALPRGERGDIVYFIRDQQGAQEPVSREVYEGLPADRQGRRDYYRRERPRLADIEVWGAGDNISPGITSGGGNLFLTGGNFAPGPGFDGDFTTNFLHLVWSPTIDRGILTVDMGATFWVDAMRISTSEPRPFIDGYIVRGSDGSRDASGRLKWSRISPRAREDNSVDRFENLLDSFTPPPKLRFLEMAIVSVDPRRRGGYNTGPNIAEYQVFSQGYPAEVLLTSDLIQLPGPRNFGGITWESETPPGTDLEVRTRTGDLLGKTIRYFDKTGTEITFDAWKNLLGSFKGPADTSFVPTSGWSPWSRPYKEQGDRVTSPGLRKYMQIQVRMTTQDRETAAAIRSIGIELLNPVAENILAEVHPAEVPVQGAIDTFEVFVQPRFIERPALARSLGFDEVLMSMPASKSMELAELAIAPDPWGNASERLFRPGAEAGILVDDEGMQVRVLRDRADSIWVRLPGTVNILADVPRTYHRVTLEGEQVPVTQDGLPLTGAAYGLLNPEEKGDILYFRKTANAAGDTLLGEIGQFDYQELAAAEKGPIRYFRILRGDGAQFPFDARGDSLSAADYNGLSSDLRGTVVGSGPQLRVRFSAPVFLNGTTLNLAVRQTNQGADAAAPWQSVEPGDASALAGSNVLSIAVPISQRIVDNFHIAPNPFTPNGDGINDEAEIRFSVFKITIGRTARLRVYTLAGSLVWENSALVRSGQESMRWPGVDHSGQRVPPGLYICQVELDVDNASGTSTRSRLVSVAY